ncbi:MAG TPA: hypothetical protein VK427_09210 [Kofleriaceae bacterium]|nr:hypothetical protein [Kofleriaceae bacterium]
MKALLASTLLALSLPAFAQPVANPPVPHAPGHRHRASFSGKRLALEILAGGAAQTLVAYGTYKSTCGDEPCLGGALGGWFAGFAVTPLVVWGVGSLTGGEGKLAHAYYGALPALAPFSATEAPIGLQFALSSVFLPITSAIMYEVSSHVASQRWASEHRPQVGVRPIAGGYAGSVSLRF